MLRPPNGQQRTAGGNFVRENTVKSIWKRGGGAVNGWLGIPSSVAADQIDPKIVDAIKTILSDNALLVNAESAGGSMC